jgi:PPK2 family polyphosphate:nucleotide phosphotransferase
MIDIKNFKIEENKKVSLKSFPTKYEGKKLTKKNSEELLNQSIKKLSVIQDMLYAHNKYGILIIFQAMDAAGKDAAIKHVMAGFNPRGVKVDSFKAPSIQELDHDYFWRHQMTLPGRGEIVIHNRSHYENVLVTRVHPQLILKEKLPTVTDISQVDKFFWESRLKQINRFEKNLVENGMVIIKFFLHVSKEEQKKRFLERIEDPSKNWKFSISDIKERAFWDDYQRAYEKAISATSSKQAPWFIIPADDKWYAWLVIASVIQQQFDKLKINYPVLNDEEKADLDSAKVQLLKEL